MHYQLLTKSDRVHFLEKGYVVLHDCFPKDIAREWVDRAYRRLGYDKHDPGTWTSELEPMPDFQLVDVKDFSPKAWTGICDCIGGEERQGGRFGTQWADSFIVNFGVRANEPWQPPGPDCEGWHKDGNFFRHYLDSPEQGLLTIVIWKDILPQSGGTFLATDSIKPVAEFLRDHPEGILPDGGFGHLVHQCRDFMEVTGECGDVVLLHPYLLHASSSNPSGRARFITNPPISLAKPLHFNRPDPADFSLVEQAVLNALDVDCLDFRVEGERTYVHAESNDTRAAKAKEQEARLHQT